MRFVGAPVPVSNRIASCHLDGLPLSLSALPVHFQSIVAQIVPSFGGGGNPWACAWSWHHSIFQRLFQAGVKAGAAPIPRLFEAMSTDATTSVGHGLGTQAAGVRWWNRLSHRVSSMFRRDQSDPWPRQSLDDGACELVGMRTLVQVRVVYDWRL